MEKAVTLAQKCNQLIVKIFKVEQMLRCKTYNPSDCKKFYKLLLKILFHKDEL